jgi:hypothetical protein
MKIYKMKSFTNQITVEFIQQTIKKMNNVIEETSRDESPGSLYEAAAHRQRIRRLVYCNEITSWITNLRSLQQSNVFCSFSEKYSFSCFIHALWIS